MAITWEDKNSVGVSVIDEQHKQFVFILDKLSRAISEMESKESLVTILHDLDQYAVYHFATEEKYFREFNYEKTEEHVEAHRNFVKKLAEIKEKYGRDELRMSLELINFMSDWLVNHIRDMDQKYTECFHNNGLY